MKIIKNNSVKLAIGLGAIAGMRSMMAPAILSHYLRRRPANGLTNSKLEFLRTSIFDKAAKFLTAGEVFGDKMPQTPDRIAAGALAGRLISGAFVGAAVFKHKNEKLWKGALIGGISSVASSFIFFYLRKQLHTKAHIHDKILGTVEDIIAVGSGAVVMDGVTK